MNYKKLYNRLIQHRQCTPADGYTEVHHIVPKCVGGSDDPTNLIALTAREHFIAHYLLSKMYPTGSNAWHKTNHAFMMMKSSNKKQPRYFNNRLYESARKHFSIVMSTIQSGEKNSQAGTRWITNPKTKESKKISKNDSIPDNWVNGRAIEIRKCKMCKLEFLLNRRQKQNAVRKNAGTMHCS